MGHKGRMETKKERGHALVAELALAGVGLGELVALGFEKPTPRSSVRILLFFLNHIRPLHLPLSNLGLSPYKTY